MVAPFPQQKLQDLDQSFLPAPESWDDFRAMSENFDRCQRSSSVQSYEILPRTTTATTPTPAANAGDYDSSTSLNSFCDSAYPNARESHCLEMSRMRRDVSHFLVIERIKRNQFPIQEFIGGEYHPCSATMLLCICLSAHRAVALPCEKTSKKPLQPPIGHVCSRASLRSSRPRSFLVLLDGEIDSFAQKIGLRLTCLPGKPSESGCLRFFDVKGLSNHCVSRWERTSLLGADTVDLVSYI